MCVGSLTPHRVESWRNCETRPQVFSRYPRRLESLTICGCNYKGSTFFSVILSPWVIVQPWHRTPTFRERTLFGRSGIAWQRNTEVPNSVFILNSVQVNVLYLRTSVNLSSRPSCAGKWPSNQFNLYCKWWTCAKHHLDKVFANGSDSNALFIDELFNNRTNAGTYRCKESNSIGNDVNHTVNVVVDCEYVKYVQYFGYLEDHCFKSWLRFRCLSVLCKNS